MTQLSGLEQLVLFIIDPAQKLTAIPTQPNNMDSTHRSSGPAFSALEATNQDCALLHWTTQIRLHSSSMIEL